MIEFIKNIFASSDGRIPMALVSFVLVVIANIFFALAVSTDAKVNHKKHGNLWASAAFLFGGVVAFVYYIFRSKLPEEVPIVCAKCGKKALKNRKKCPHCGSTSFVPLQFENREAVRTRIIAFLAAAIVLLAFNTWFTQYSPWAQSEEEQLEELFGAMTDDTFGVHYPYEADGETVYYDRKGISYLDSYEVPYYDKEGNAYVYQTDIGFVGENETIEVKEALVDSNGYILSAYSQFETIPDILPFKTQDGTMYYSADMVSWNKDGNMVYTSNGNTVN